MQTKHITDANTFTILFFIWFHFDAKVKEKQQLDKKSKLKKQNFSIVEHLVNFCK